MRAVQSWLDEYGESHRNPVNKRIHWICVPLIMVSLIAMLWAVPLPGHWNATATAAAAANCGTLLVVLSLLYYFALSPRLALGMTVVSLLMLLGVMALDRLPGPVWAAGLVVFVAAWVGQFIGHKIEGRKPSFFKDLQFLLIGPVWLLAALYRRLHLSY